MFVRNRSINLKITLDTSPSSQYTDGAYPIVIQIIHNRKVSRKRTGFRAYPDQWDNERFISDRRVVRDYDDRNIQLNQLEEKSISILNKHFEKTFDYKRFSSLIDQEHKDGLSFADVCKWYVEELHEQGRAGTALYYRDVGTSVENYQNGVLIDEIDRSWIRGYVRYYTMKGAKCISYLRGMKAIFGVAMNEFDLDFNAMPFKTAYNPKGYDLSEANKIKVRTKLPRKGWLIKCLSPEQISTLKNYKPVNQGK
jgi:hypothetical protein